MLEQLPELFVAASSLAEVKFEQKELGNPEFGCDLSPIDFAAFARMWRGGFPLRDAGPTACGD